MQVLSNMALRLAVMHEAGFVHRDLKPANVMWLPRENRWTVIDFGCAARVGEMAPLSFTLAYAAPEVVEAHEEGRGAVQATEELDAWSLGVMAFELLTGAPAFKFLTEGRTKVRLVCVHKHTAAGGSLHRRWQADVHPATTQTFSLLASRNALALSCIHMHISAADAYGDHGTSCSGHAVMP